MRGDYAGLAMPDAPERRRLEHLARRLNPGTQRCLRERGIGLGWRCLEVGAAEGSMSRWMAEQVGPDGRVVAADIDLRFLDGVAGPNLEVRRLDLRSDALEPDHYDLAYCRTLLLHLPDPLAALARLVASLRPGGWLVVQEPDVGSASAADLSHPHAETYERLIRRAYGWVREREIFDAYFGRRLPHLLDRLGLVDVGSEGTVCVVRSPEEKEVFLETLRAMLPMLRAKEVLSAEEAALLEDLYRDPGFDLLSEIQVAAWGRKPDG